MLTREFFARSLWLCPLAGIVLAAAVLIFFGVSAWSALLAALLLVCPALTVWSAWRDGGLAMDSFGWRTRHGDRL